MGCMAENMQQDLTSKESEGKIIARKKATYLLENSSARIHDANGQKVGELDAVKGERETSPRLCTSMKGELRSEVKKQN